MTIAQWIEHCRAAMEEARLCFGHGTDNAHDESAWLVLHVVEAPCDGSFDDWHRPVGDAQAERIRALLERRIAERSPLAYLLGEAWFCGLPFTVTPAVLVPRSPIAELIRRRFEPWVDQDSVENVLDLCTGSGCIAVATACYLPTARVHATDLSAEALEVAAANVARHGMRDRVELVRSDLFAKLAGQRYDLIVSNPPYVPEDARDSLPAEFRAEPGLGLYGGGDGLGLVLQILEEAPAHLADHGVLICEVGASAGRLEQALPGVPFTWLEFEHGGDGVFTIGARELQRAGPSVRALMSAR